jgi:hypothetical protein
MTGAIPTQQQGAPPIGLQRIDAEFQALNETFGAPRQPDQTKSSPLMPPAILNASAGTLTLQISAPAPTTTTATLRYRGLKPDVPNKVIYGTTINLTAAETVDLIAVEMIDNGLLTGMGAVSKDTPLFTGTFAPVSITATTGPVYSTDETSIVAATLPTGSLKVGSTFRITARGTVQVKRESGTGTADSGWLRFKTFVGADAAAQVFELATVTADLGPSVFNLEVDATVRTAAVSATGTLGTYLTNGYGAVEFAPTDIRPIVPVASTIGTTAPVDTDAPSPVVKLTAQWQKEIDNNRLQVDIATIAQIV